MQNIKELLDHLLRINARIIPCFDDALHYVLDYKLGNLTCRLIEDHVEVVLSEDWQNTRSVWTLSARAESKTPLKLT